MNIVSKDSGLHVSRLLPNVTVPRGHGCCSGYQDTVPAEVSEARRPTGFIFYAFSHFSGLLDSFRCVDALLGSPPAC